MAVYNCERTNQLSNAWAPGVPVCLVDPARQLRKSILLRTICVVDDLPAVEVVGLGDLDVDRGSLCSRGKGIPNVVDFDQAGVRKVGCYDRP